jgi:hypothetical protein
VAFFLFFFLLVFVLISSFSFGFREGITADLSYEIIYELTFPHEYGQFSTVGSLNDTEVVILVNIYEQDGKPMIDIISTDLIIGNLGTSLHQPIFHY